MKNNCINLKQKLDRTLYCKKQNKKINISECSGCQFKEYKSICQKNEKTQQTKSYPPKKLKNSADKPKKYKKSGEIAKLERNRFSILTNDLEHCIICGAKKDHLHEVFFGRNRLNSMKYGLVIPLCYKCHSEMHLRKDLQDIWHKKGQEAFESAYPELDFVEIFKKNYL